MNNAKRRTPRGDHGRTARVVCPKRHRVTPGIEPTACEASQMQRIAQGGAFPGRSHRSIRRTRRPISACTGGNTGASGVVTLAPAFTNALPTLDGMPFSYSHEFHAELLYELCTVLVRGGIGRTRDMEAVRGKLRRIRATGDHRRGALGLRR